jgi:hypothetical protein
VDILNSTWNNVDYFELYDPITQDFSKDYSFINQKGASVNIVGQKNVTDTGLLVSNMNLGFYPKVINNMYYFMTGQNLFTNYTTSEFDKATVEGLNVDYIPNSSIELPKGFDPNNSNRVLKLKTWFVSFDTKNSSKFSPMLELEKLSSSSP